MMVFSHFTQINYTAVKEHYFEYSGSVSIETNPERAEDRIQTHPKGETCGSQQDRIRAVEKVSAASAQKPVHRHAAALQKAILMFLMKDKVRAISVLHNTLQLVTKFTSNNLYYRFGRILLMSWSSTY